MDQETFALAGEGEEGWDEALRGAKNSTVTLRRLSSSSSVV
jgi:hypothetical protein